MEPFHVLTIGLGVLGFFLQALVLAVTGTRALGRMEAGLRDAISEHRTQIDTEIGGMRRDLTADADRVRREAGEATAALRAKIHEVEERIRDVEVWARDEFIRKESFLLVTGEVKAAMAKQTETIDMRLNQVAAELKAVQIAMATAAPPPKG